MPLMQAKSKKAFSKNVKTEMEADKPQKQSLAIAYSVKRKNAKKKMAEGGEITAKGENRPMPDEEFNDSSDVSMNRGKKSLGKSDWTDDTYSDQASRSFSKPQREMDTDFVNESEAEADNAYDFEEMDMEKESSSDPLDINEHHYEDIEDAKYARGGEVGNPKLEESHKMPSDEDEHYDNIADAILAKKRRSKYADGGMVDLEANSEEAPHYGYKQNLKAYMKEQYDDSQISSQPEDSNEMGDSREDESENEHDADIVSSIRRKMKSKRS